MFNNSFVALVKREVLENKNSFIKVPVILLGIAILVVLATVMGLTNQGFLEEMAPDGEIYNVGSMMNHALTETDEDGLGGAITVGYWAFSMVPLLVLPFIMFFSLLGSLYEERRDNTILFWKSMPVSDWQEVVAKLVAAVFIAPLLVLAVMIVGQVLTMVIISFTSLVQGGPFFALWPIATMILSWIHFVLFFALQALWMLPLFAWLLLASAYAPRMPFMYAVLPPALVILIQGVFFESANFAEWLAVRVSPLNMMNGVRVDIHGPRDLFSVLDFSVFGSALANSFMSVGFWFGLAIAGGLLFGAVELRKRAV